MSKTIFVLFMLLVVSLQQAWSHDAWLAEKDGALMVIWGHGDKSEPYDPRKVKEAKAFDSKGDPVPAEISKQKDSASISSSGKPATVTALFDYGYGARTSDGWKKMTKREAQVKFSVIEALKSRRYAKGLLAPCEGFSKPVGLAFEIVPQKDPFAVKPGEVLPIEVLLDGKPLGGALIAIAAAGHYDSKDQLKSDLEGRATVAIPRAGFQIITASYKAPIKDDPDADVLSLSTSLTFETK